MVVPGVRQGSGQGGFDTSSKGTPGTRRARSRTEFRVTEDNERRYEEDKNQRHYGDSCPSYHHGNMQLGIV